MANSFDITSIVTKVGFTAFKYNAPFTRTITDKSEVFGNFSATSKKTGPSIEVDKPVRTKTIVTDPATGAAFNDGDWVNDSATLTINRYATNHLAFPTFQEALSLSEGQKEIAKEVGESIAYNVEEDMIDQSISKVPYAVLAGSSGLVLDDAGSALSIIKENGKMGELYMLAPQTLQSKLTNNNRTLFNPANEISRQYREGTISGRAAGFTWYSSEMVPIHTNGTATDGTFDTATGMTPLGTVTAIPANGAVQLQIEGIGTNGTITAGTVLHIANVDGVNLRTYKNNGRARTFCVASTVTSVAGAVTVTLTEKMIDSSGTNESATLQNITALPQTGAVVSYVGKVSTSYKQALAYSKESFMKSFCKLTDPWAGAKGSIINKEGIIIRGIVAYDKDVDENVFRGDSSYGVAPGRLEWAVRLLQEI